MSWAVEHHQIIWEGDIPNHWLDNPNSIMQMLVPFVQGDITLEIGADRTQLFFTFAGQLWVLQFEALCEAIWIECLQKPSEQSLYQLHQQLTQCAPHC